MLVATTSLWSGGPHAGYMPPLGYAALSYLNIPLASDQRVQESKSFSSQNLPVAQPKPKRQPRKPKQAKRWFEILSELERDPNHLASLPSAGTSTAFQQFVKTSIAAATKAAEKDKQWADSGVVQLLQQASRLVIGGDVQEARLHAVSLLDFHKIAAALRKASYGYERKTSASSICETCGSPEPCDCHFNNQQLGGMPDITAAITDDARNSSLTAASSNAQQSSNNLSIPSSRSTAMAPPKRPAPASQDQQQALKRTKSAPYKPSQSGFGANGDAPKEMPPNCKEVLRGIHSRLHDGSVDCAEAPEQVLSRDNFTKPDFKQWSGRLKHKRGASVTELCPITISIPQLYMEQMPAALYATDILHRKQISLGKHLTCRCSLGSLTSKQRDSLTAMARTQLVAIVELQYCALHLVPYFDNSNNLKVVGFLKLYT